LRRSDFSRETNALAAEMTPAIPKPQLPQQAIRHFRRRIAANPDSATNQRVES